MNILGLKNTEDSSMWRNIEELLSGIAKINYVFLRNTECIRNDFSEDDDWDVLCDDISQFIKAAKACPLNDRMECYNYYTNIAGKRLLLDIRCVGDNYYDKQWECDMLASRLWDGKYYILNGENKKYSLLYHGLIHKLEFSRLKYDEYYNNTFGVVDMDSLIKIMRSFLAKKNYTVVVPYDKGVCFNEINAKLLGGDIYYGGKN